MANLILSPEDITSGDWTNSGCVLASNVATSPRGDVTADSLQDNNAGAFEFITQSGASYSGGNITMSAYVKKDAIAPSTRFPMLRFGTTGAAARRVDIKIDTQGGVITASASTPTMLKDSGILEDGDYWRPWATIDDDSVGNSALQFEIFAAAGANADLTTLSASAQGTTIVWGILIEPGSVVNDYYSSGGLQLVRDVTRNVTFNVTRNVFG